jgi:hypothetical protein
MGTRFDVSNDVTSCVSICTCLSTAKNALRKLVWQLQHAVPHAIRPPARLQDAPQQRREAAYHFASATSHITCDSSMLSCVAPHSRSSTKPHTIPTISQIPQISLRLTQMHRPHLFLHAMNFAACAVLPRNLGGWKARRGRRCATCDIVRGSLLKRVETWCTSISRKDWAKVDKLWGVVGVSYQMQRKYWCSDQGSGGSNVSGHGVWRVSDDVVASRRGKDRRVRDMNNRSEGNTMCCLDAKKHVTGVSMTSHSTIQ